MAKFVEFEFCTTTHKVFINPEFVWAIYPEGDGTAIDCQNDGIIVKGTPAEVAAKLTEAQQSDDQ